MCQIRAGKPAPLKGILLPRKRDCSMSKALSWMQRFSALNASRTVQKLREVISSHTRSEGPLLAKIASSPIIGRGHLVRSSELELAMPEPFGNGICRTRRRALEDGSFRRDNRHSMGMARPARFDPLERSVSKTGKDGIRGKFAFVLNIYGVPGGTPSQPTNTVG